MLLSRPNKIEVIGNEDGELPVTLAERVIETFHVSHLKSSVDYGQPTTAIVLNGNVFLVLNDPTQSHWGRLQKLLINTNAVRNALDYFVENIKDANPRSEHHYYSIDPEKDHYGLHKMVVSYLGVDWLEKVHKLEKGS